MDNNTALIIAAKDTMVVASPNISQNLPFSKMPTTVNVTPVAMAT